MLTMMDSTYYYIPMHRFEHKSKNMHSIIPVAMETYVNSNISNAILFTSPIGVCVCV